MNDKQDELHDMMWEKYRAHLEGLSEKALLEYFSQMSKKQLIDIIQEADPVGKGDCGYES